MLHHISFSVSDLNRSARFYKAVLEPLGYRCVDSTDTFVGYGLEDNKDLFAIKFRGKEITPPSIGFHLAFSAPNRESVDKFYKAALENGGKDNGSPGLRPQYGENYYAAFVIDPDGYQIEAVINKAI
jgi:catechol 2,3-dioxygenase-like lactoylglutathione lyase family enzyme